jgi:hypothetical protein
MSFKNHLKKISVVLSDRPDRTYLKKWLLKEVRNNRASNYSSYLRNATSLSPQVYVLGVEAAADLQGRNTMRLKEQTGGLSAGKRYRDK